MFFLLIAYIIHCCYNHRMWGILALTACHALYLKEDEGACMDAAHSRSERNQCEAGTALYSLLWFIVCLASTSLVDQIWQFEKRLKGVSDDLTVAFHDGLIQTLTTASAYGLTRFFFSSLIFGLRRAYFDGENALEIVMYALNHVCILVLAVVMLVFMIALVISWINTDLKAHVRFVTSQLGNEQAERKRQQRQQEENEEEERKEREVRKEARYRVYLERIAPHLQALKNEPANEIGEKTKFLKALFESPLFKLKAKLLMSQRMMGYLKPSQADAASHIFDQTIMLCGSADQNLVQWWMGVPYRDVQKAYIKMGIKRDDLLA
jgi:hypothetical protein